MVSSSAVYKVGAFLRSEGQNVPILMPLYYRYVTRRNSSQDILPVKYFRAIVGESEKIEDFKLVGTKRDVSSLATIFTTDADMIDNSYYSIDGPPGYALHLSDGQIFARRGAAQFARDLLRDHQNEVLDLYPVFGILLAQSLEDHEYEERFAIRSMEQINRFSKKLMMSWAKNRDFSDQVRANVDSYIDLISLGDGKLDIDLSKYCVQKSQRIAIFGNIIEQVQAGSYIYKGKAFIVERLYSDWKDLAKVYGTFGTVFCQSYTMTDDGKHQWNLFNRSEDNRVFLVERPAIIKASASHYARMRGTSLIPIERSKDLKPADVFNYANPEE